MNVYKLNCYQKWNVSEMHVTNNSQYTVLSNKLVYRYNTIYNCFTFHCVHKRT